MSIGAVAGTRTRGGRGTKRGRILGRRVDRPGDDPKRILLVGSGAFESTVGGEASLSDLLADRLWLRTRSGVELHALDPARRALAAIAEGTAADRLWQYDAVVLIAGDRRIPGLVDGLRDAFEDTIAGVRRDCHSIVVSLGRGRHRGLPEERSSELVVPSLDPTIAADRIAGRLELLLGPTEPIVVPAGTASDLVPQRTALRLDRIVDLLRQAYGTTAAAINLVHRDSMVTVAAVGDTCGGVPRSAGLCERTMQEGRLIVVSDVLEGSGGGSAAAAGVRFYAGRPIESASGEAIGSLCVYDPQPQGGVDFDWGPLRDFALLAEAELIDAHAG